MLLGDFMLSHRAVARVWCHRERIEWEAADQFARLAEDLAATGAPSVLVEMARRAAADEVDHAGRCRRVVQHLCPGMEAEPPVLGVVLGPRSLSRMQRALYASVAISCVTESLSTALLIEMRRWATDPLVADTVTHIVKDEVRHSRLGWAHLAWAHDRMDLSWLAIHVPGMIRSALRLDPAGDGEPMEAAELGVLGGRAIDIARQTVFQLVIPGLARFGIEYGCEHESASAGCRDCDHQRGVRRLEHSGHQFSG